LESVLATSAASVYMKGMICGFALIGRENNKKIYAIFKKNGPQMDGENLRTVFFFLLLSSYGTTA
jgi:hypothetical protein